MNKYSIGQKFKARHKLRDSDDYIYVIKYIHGVDDPEFCNYTLEYYDVNGKHVSNCVLTVDEIQDLLIEIEVS